MKQLRAESDRYKCQPPAGAYAHYPTRPLLLPHIFPTVLGIPFPDDSSMTLSLINNKILNQVVSGR